MAQTGEPQTPSAKKARPVGRYLLCGALIFLLFGLVYWRSLSFVYIEGDDATLVAYHALGRDLLLQPPYAAYTSMYDALFGMLPPRESTIRIGMLSLTAISLPILFFLMILLAGDWCASLEYVPEWLSAALLLLATPEFFYLGLVLTPSATAMTFVVGAHLILRRSTARRRWPEWIGFAASLLLFGFGASLRWDTVTYGATIAADLLLRAGDRAPEGPAPVGVRVRLAGGWGALALAAWLGCVRINGWGPVDVFRIILSSGPVEAVDWIASIARIQPLFTPAFLLLCGTGLYWLLRCRHPLGIVVLIAIIPVAKLMLFGVPKWFLTAIPAMLACAMAGLTLVWARSAAWRYALLGLLLLPWVIGIRLTLGGGAWGPGFESRPFDGISMDGTWPRLVFGSGSALPTAEGPRALFGHAGALLCDWKPFVDDGASEQVTAVNKSIEMGLPLVEDGGLNEAVVVYASLGLTTSDAWNRSVDHQFSVERRFLGKNGKYSRLLKLKHRSSLFEVKAIEQLRRETGDAVVISGYTSTLHRLWIASPNSLEKLGKITAILHLDKLQADVAAGDSPQP